MKTYAQTLYPWLKSNLGKRCLAPLTSCDSAALLAAVQVIGLYSYARDPAVLMAFRAVVERMQVNCRFFAFHAIAHVLDWNDRHTIWREAGLAHLPRFQPCEFEPKPGAFVALLDQAH